MKNRCLSWANQGDIGRLVGVLQRDGVVLGPSDTVIGLLAPLSDAGFKALNKLKKRTQKPYLVLVQANGMAKIQKMAHIPQNEAVSKLMQACWPGPLTLILKAQEDIPFYMKSLQGEIAIRVPDHKGLQTLLTHFDGLFSTSANITGEPVPSSLDEVSPTIKEAVAFCINDESPKTLGKISASTILDVTRKTIRLVREGAYSKQQLEKICGQTLDLS